MPPGPLPSAGARRRNAPTIPTTTLPASGRKGRPPNPPKAYEFRAAGQAWWKWAWATPQAAAWDPSALYTAARRAQLEDDLATLKLVDNFELAELLGIDEENEALRRLAAVIGTLKSLAGGEVTLMKEMRELDGKLGLNPEALAKLRWMIIDEEEQPTPAPRPGGRAKKPASAKHLRAV